METDANISDICKMCLGECNAYENPALNCQGKCQQKIHISCLKRGALPSNFIGDVFYDLHCIQCSGSNNELLVRQKLPWLTTVILTLYNLREKSSGISRRGYFHWKSDISTFINNNWDQLFTKTVKKKKNWIGTISGTLSHYSGIFFKSGTAELGDQGWWKLIDNDPPEVLIDKYYKILELKKQNQSKLRTKNNDSLISESKVVYEENNSSQSEIIKSDEVKPFLHTLHKVESNVEIYKNICKKDKLEDILDLDIDIPNIEDDFASFNFIPNSAIEELPFEDYNELQDIFISDCTQNVPEVVEDISEDVNISDIPLSENGQEVDETAKMEYDNNELCEQKDENDKSELPPPHPSLFTQSIKRPWPWDESIKLNEENIKPLMSEREEEFLLQKIEQYKHLLDVAPPTVRRLYRKLAVRKLQRQYSLPILNIDIYGKNQNHKTIQIKKKGNIVLDRFISEDVSMFYEQRLQGHCEPTSVHSPYTNRLLKPFIRRDTISRPLWLRITSELLTKVNGKKTEWKPKPVAPIDYSYVRPQHIPAMNSLCTQFFWPGVDLTECLQYPDFTCVVLYKKLVVGFAIMVPDVGYNEAYISFILVRPEWQKAGIGTFMLYHLIQTCMGKDITLHVSATNSALILYQKFGFKQEEFVQDFYDKYILPSSKESKHALFLRLRR